MKWVKLNHNVLRHEGGKVFKGAFSWQRKSFLGPGCVGLGPSKVKYTKSVSPSLVCLENTFYVGVGEEKVILLGWKFPHLVNLEDVENVI